MDQKTDQSADDTRQSRSRTKPRGSEEFKKRFGFRLSPVNRRRLERFKAHKLGISSFLIFSGLFLIRSLPSSSPTTGR